MISRSWKEVAGTRTCFLYSDENLIGEYTADGTETKTYGYKPNSTWTTDPLFLKTQDTYYFYHNDHLGTPHNMSGINGNIVWSANHEAYGNAEVDKFFTVLNKIRFPGQLYDEETGLHYNYHRYYNSKTSRYFQRIL